MSRQHHGRHSVTDEGSAVRHHAPEGERGDDRYEGRHRAVAVQRAAVSPLLAASGTLAAAALAAIMLSGQQDGSVVLSGQLDPGGELLAERELEPRPASAMSRGGALPADDVARVDGGLAPGAGLGTALSLSVWGVLVECSGGAPSAELAGIFDAVPDGTAGDGAPSSGAAAPAGPPSWTPTDSVPAPRQEPTAPPSVAATQRPGAPAPTPSHAGDEGGRVPEPVVEPLPGGMTGPRRPATDPVRGPVGKPVAPEVGPVAEAVEDRGAGRRDGDPAGRAGDGAATGSGGQPGRGNSGNAHRGASD